MSEHVYSHSMFWSALSTSADLTSLVWPVLFIIGCGIWAARQRSKVAGIGLFGALLLMCGVLTQQFNSGVGSVSLGKELQPLIDQNPVSFILFAYGVDFGAFFIALSLVLHFSQKSGTRRGN